ncbi:MAG TPA: dUTP diphosphatase [Gemmatimonadota bacterium]|nr:dUTP diphosphatase [Gemmatimonadota bacterium]
MNPDEITVFVELLPDHPSFTEPDAARFVPARAGDAGIDLVACESVILAPGERAAVSAGIRIALPEGIEGQVRPRSGRALREGLAVVNAPGTIDPGYRGPVKVLLLNAAPAIEAADLDGDPATLAERLRAGLARRTVNVEVGERIAQLVFARFERPTVHIVAEVPRQTERGEGGLGSTGIGPLNSRSTGAPS